MKISLCMIVKNEEKNIKECLDRALKVVDEAIIVDTGSTDSTRDILRDFEKDKKIKLIDYKWEKDFSKARNKSIEYATGDWILVLDADERIFCDREKLESILNKATKCCYNIPIYNVFSKTEFTVSSAMIRLYKNNKPSYTGAIHEQIFINGIQQMGEIIDKDICKIYHYGYSDSVFEEKNKSKRNMDIIKSQIKKEPKDPFHWYNKGVMELIDGKYDKALDDFIKSHELCNGFRMSFHNQLLMGMVQSMYLLNQFKNTVNFIESLLEDEDIKHMPDFPHYLGLCYINLKQYDKAIDSFKRAISIGEYYGGISKYGTGSYLPMTGYAEALKLKGEIKQSIEKYKEAIFHKNNPDMVGLNELSILLKSENMNKELAELEKEILRLKDNEKNNLEGETLQELSKSKDDFKNNIQTLIEQGLIEEAKDLINEYENIIKSDPSIYSMRGIIYMIEKDMRQAEEILKVGLEKYQENFDIIYNLGYLYQVENRDELSMEYYKRALLNTEDDIEQEEAYMQLQSLGVEGSKDEIINDIFEKDIYEEQGDCEIFIKNTYHNNTPKAEDSVYRSRKNVLEASYDDNTPLVSLIVTGYNKLEQHTKTCVECILKYTKGIDYELILVDNGSSDGTLEYFKSVKYYKKTIIRVTKNIGAFYGGNLGLNLAKGQYIVGVSNDIYVTENWLSNMLKCAMSDETIGMVVPMSDEVSNLQSINLGFNSFEDMQKKASEFNISDSKKWNERLRLAPVISMFKRECLDMIGLQDYGFFHDFADDDITFRVRRAGYKAILCKDVFVQHAGGFGEKDPEKYNKSLKVGRNIFKDKYYGIDAWNDASNYELKMISYVECNEKDLSDNIDILGIDVACGTPILEIKNKLRERGLFDVKLSAFSNDPKYWLDLKTICKGKVEVDREEYLLEKFNDNKFNYILLGKPINNYKQPYKLLKDIIELLVDGGQLIIKLINTYDVLTLLKTLDSSIQVNNQNIYHILIEDIKKKLVDSDSYIKDIGTEPYDIDKNILENLGLKFNTDNDYKNAITKNYIISIIKGK